MKGPRALADLAAVLLPSWSRDRYAAEFHAELAELGPAARWAHASGLLLTAPLLRITVVRAQALAAGFHPTIGCLTGVRHRWRATWNEDGERYQRCRRCGADHTPSRSGPLDFTSPNAFPR
jgi:hypothetical protein